MKKWLLCIMCILLIGCQKQEKFEENEDVEINDSIGWVGDYCNSDSDILLSIYYLENNPNYFEFRIEHDGNGFGDYAFFEDQQKHNAVYHSSQSNYSLKFILKDNKVLIKESGKNKDLNKVLAGEYERK